MLTKTLQVKILNDVKKASIQVNIWGYFRKDSFKQNNFYKFFLKHQKQKLSLDKLQNEILLYIYFEKFTRREIT